MSGADSAPGWDQSDVTNIPLADSNGQFTTAQTYTRSFGNVWCNGPANVTIAASALKNAATVSDQSSFTNRFDLEVTGGALVYVGGNANSTIATAASGDGTASMNATTLGAFETGLGQYSAVNIKVLPSLGNNEPKRAVAGAYNGAVTFTATPVM